MKIENYKNGKFFNTCDTNFIHYKMDSSDYKNDVGNDTVHKWTIIDSKHIVSISSSKVSLWLDFYVINSWAT